MDSDSSELSDTAKTPRPSWFSQTIAELTQLPPHPSPGTASAKEGIPYPWTRDTCRCEAELRVSFSVNRCLETKGVPLKKLESRA